MNNTITNIIVQLRIKYDTGSKTYIWGSLCDTNIGNSLVDNDAAVHSYIMGFQYETVLITGQLHGRFKAKYGNAWMDSWQ